VRYDRASWGFIEMRDPEEELFWAFARLVWRYSKCGAKTRKGTPCQMRPAGWVGRCRLHGGLSTGPRTAEGRERVAEAQRRRWAAWRAAKSRKGGHQAEV